MTIENHEETMETSDSEGLAAVREARERALARADSYRQQLVETRLSQMGLAPNEGLGVAIVESFKGEPTLEEISAFAAEKYKYTYDPQAPTKVSSNAPAEQYQQAAQAVDIVMAGTQQVAPTPTAFQRVQEVEARYTRAVDEGEPPTSNEVLGGIAAKLRAAQ